MKVFRFYSDDEQYVYSGADENEAKEALFEHIGECVITKVEEIPEDQWDEKNINVWEDNDMDKAPFKVSIRECLSGDTPICICTTAWDF